MKISQVITISILIMSTSLYAENCFVCKYRSDKVSSWGYDKSKSVAKQIAKKDCEIKSNQIKNNTKCKFKYCKFDRR